MARFGSIGTQYLDNSGNVLSGGFLAFYTSGSTVSPANLITVYSDINLTTPITNPVTLDAYGRQPSIFFNGAAKAVLSTSLNVTLQTLDPVGQTDTSSQLQPWVSTYSYSQYDLVLYSGSYYISLQNSNIGNTPGSSPAYWQLYFAVLNSSGLVPVATGGTNIASYTAGDVIYASGTTTLAKLGIGTAYYNLSVNSGGTAPVYQASLQSLMTTQGDIVYASSANTPARLAKGTAYQNLSMNSGATAPAYQASLQSLMTTQGDVVYASSANTPARLAIGSALQYLRVNSGATGLEYATLNTSSYSLLATLTPSVAANLDALTTFTSSYDAYQIIAETLIPSADDTLYIRFANSGSVDSGSNYSGSGTFGSQTLVNLSSAAVKSASSKGCNFNITVTNTNDASHFKDLFGRVFYQDTSGNPAQNGPSNQYTGGAISGVRFYWASGSNFTATGKVYIYGIKNS